MVQVAIIGYGTVGSGVAEVIERNAESIAKKAGQKIEVKYICDIRDFTDDPNQDKLIKDFSIILNDPDISVVVESIGGLKPAYQFVKDSLLAHKSVVTSNKELVATKGWELLKIAREPVSYTHLDVYKRQVRPFITPSNILPSFSYMTFGSSQLLVGPASFSSLVQMNVLCSTRATSFSAVLCR